MGALPLSIKEMYFKELKNPAFGGALFLFTQQ